MNYRDEARRRLAAAKAELSSGDDARLKYAALELRMSMEALTYDRALAYKDEFPPDEYQTWQPRRIMSVLLEIDPSADADRSIAIGAELEYGVPAPSMRSLGTEQVLNMTTLKRHYDALGSFLHMHSMKQMMEGKVVDAQKLRNRCEELSALVDAALSSPIFNVTLGAFARVNCFRCNLPIRKRLPNGAAELDAECFECHATYSVVPLENGQVEWRARRQEVSCARDGCTGATYLWDADLQAGRFWKCGACGGRNVIVLTLQHEPGGE